MKEIKEQLKQLKQIEPDQDWVRENRSILKSQVESAGLPREASFKEKTLGFFAYILKSFRSRIVRPVWAGAAVLLLVLLGGGAIVQASGDAKPGTLLYYARIAKEKTQIATTFDKKEKSKLSLKFAGEHAKDITEVLDEPGSKDEEATKKLSRNFEESLESVKMSLKEMGVEGENAETEEGEDSTESKDTDKKDERISGEKDPEENAGNKAEGNEEEPKKDSDEQGSEEEEKEETSEEEIDSSEEFFTVGSGKEEEGMEVYDPKREEKQNTEQKIEISSETEEGSAENTTSSKISEKIETAEDLASEQNQKLNNLIKEAEDLFEKGKYTKAGQKIEEVMQVVEDMENKTEEGSGTEEEDPSTPSASSGQVKGTKETATSAPEEASSTTESTPEESASEEE